MTKKGRNYSKILQRRELMWHPDTHSEFSSKVLAEFKRLEEINRKDYAYRFVEECGVTAVKHKVFSNVYDALSDELPTRFVLKPLIGHSSAGVHLLERGRGESLYDHMTGSSFKCAGELASYYNESISKLVNNIGSTDVIIEEYVHDSQNFAVPLDYKVYAFYTGAILVMQRYAPMHGPTRSWLDTLRIRKRGPKAHWKFEFYDRNGSAMGPIRDGTATPSRLELQRPDNFSEIISIAERLVRASETSFIRVDLYSTPSSVLFGEFTPSPNNGKEKFNAEWDARLGRAWEESLRQLNLQY